MTLSNASVTPRHPPVAALPPQFAPRSSIGVRQYANCLADALSRQCGLESTVIDRPARFGGGGHFHIANSTRSLLPFLLAVSQPVLLTIHDLMPRSHLLRSILTKIQYHFLHRFPVVVHSDLAGDLLRRQGMHQDIHVIPHAADPISQSPERIAKIRAGFVGDGERMLVSAGILNKAKQVPEVIRAVDGLPGLALVLLGRIADAETQRAFDRAGRNVHHVPDPDDALFQEVIASADYLLNFRTESVGEASGPVALAYAAGVPIVGYAVGTQSEFKAPSDQLFPLNRSIGDCVHQIAGMPTSVRPRREGRLLTWQDAASRYLRIYDIHGLTRR